MPRIIFAGHDFDLFDNETRVKVARQYAEQLVQRICDSATDNFTSDQQRLHDQLEVLVAALTDYWLQAGCTLAMAAKTGSVGISLAQAEEMHNYIGGLIDLDAPKVARAEDALEAIASLEGGDAEG